MTRVCSNCGKEMDDSAAFCPSCGKAVGQPDAEPDGSTSNPLPAGGAPNPSPVGTVGGIDGKLAAALSYLWIVAIVLLVLEPYNRDRFVRFHAFQALFLGIAGMIVNFVLGAIPVLGWALLPFWSIAVIALAIIGAVKAYQGLAWEMPVIGPIARQQADKA